MELIETTLSPVQRRAGAALVGWADLVAQQRRRGQDVRVLTVGDDVVLHVDGHGFHAGRVVGHLGSGATGSYVVTLGAPLARGRALRLAGLAGLGESTTGDPACIRVIDVEARVVPAQRSPRVSLYL